MVLYIYLHIQQRAYRPTTTQFSLNGQKSLIATSPNLSTLVEELTPNYNTTTDPPKQPKEKQQTTPSVKESSEVTKNSCIPSQGCK